MFMYYFPACISDCSSCRIPNTCSVGQCNGGYGYDVAENKCKRKNTHFV